jgi:hypothetical protein
MQYVLLIHAAESQYASFSKEKYEAYMQAYVKYSNAIEATKRSGDCAPLEQTSTATTVQVRDGKRIVKDGPFAETREQLGGYYAFDAKSEEEAIEWASKIPDAEGGTIEVRPIITMGGRPAAPKKEGKDYLLLIYEAEAVWAKMTPAEREATSARYRALGAKLNDAGKFIGGEKLDSVKKAKSVSMDGDKRIVRDGPFAETREQLGGYYRIYARDLDEAIAFAAEIPAAETGTIEVRPAMDVSAYF